MAGRSKRRRWAWNERTKVWCLEEVAVVRRYSFKFRKFPGHFSIKFKGPKKFVLLINRAFFQVLKALRRDLTTRRAVATLWPESGDDGYFSCITQVQVLVRDEELHAIWHMRSSDDSRYESEDLPSMRLFSRGLAWFLGGVERVSMTVVKGSEHSSEGAGSAANFLRGR
jgi:hypothetical protein